MREQGWSRTKRVANATRHRSTTKGEQGGRGKLADSTRVREEGRASLEYTQSIGLSVVRTMHSNAHNDVFIELKTCFQTTTTQSIASLLAPNFMIRLFNNQIPYKTSSKNSPLRAIRSLRMVIRTGATSCAKGSLLEIALFEVGARPGLGL